MAILALVAFWACTPTVPSKYIQPDDLEDILYDYHLSQAMAQREQNFQQGQKDRTKYFYAVLAKHNVTEADFDSSMVYYYSNIPQLQKIYSAVEERMDNEANHLGATIASVSSTYSANGDTTNVWKTSSSAMLMPIAPYNKLDFALKVDTSYHKGDTFLMSFNAEFLYQSGTKDGVIYMAVTFDNDSTAQYYTHFTSSGLSQLRIPSNFENSIRKIVGFIYLAKGSDNSKTTKLLFVDNISLLRYHKKELVRPNNSTSSPTTRHDSIKGGPPNSMPIPETPPTPNKGTPTQPLRPIKSDVK